MYSITTGKVDLNNHLGYRYLLNSNTRDKSQEETKKKITRNWWKLSPLSNAQIRYCPICEQKPVGQASWYTENPAIKLPVHLLPHYGAIHGDFAKIWEQTLQWFNQSLKTNLCTTCWGILATPAVDGLGCIGELIRNFTGLITALRR